MASHAIVHMGFGAELARMHNGENLPGQEQRYGELCNPVVLSDWQHGAILHEMGPHSTRPAAYNSMPSPRSGQPLAMHGTEQTP